MQHRGVHVVDIELVLHRTVAELVSRTVGDAGLGPAAGHPNGEAKRVVIAAIAALRERRAAKLTGPHNKRVLQHAARFQVAQQPGNRLVGCAGVVAMIFLQATVGVPAVVAADPRAGQLDEAHALLHQSAGDETLHAERARRVVLGVEPIKFTRCLGLALDIDQLRHGRLHAVGHLVIRDGRLELVHLPQPIEHALIEFVQQSQLGLLNARPAFARANVRQRFLAGLEHCCLMTGRQEAVAKIVPTAGRDQAAVEHDKARQIRCLGAQPVAHPRAHARAALHTKAGVQKKIRTVVLGKLGGHRAHHAQLIRHLADVRE